MNGLEKWAKVIPQQVQERMAVLGLSVFDSVVDGSALTGSPGQPVGSGEEKASWQLTHDSPTSARIHSESDHAAAIEEGINPFGPVHFKTGGPHSLAQTVINFDRLVEHAFPTGWAGQ